METNYFANRTDILQESFFSSVERDSTYLLPSPDTQFAQILHETLQTKSAGVPPAVLEPLTSDTTLAVHNSYEDYTDRWHPEGGRSSDHSSNDHLSAHNSIAQSEGALSTTENSAHHIQSSPDTMAAKQDTNAQQAVEAESKENAVTSKEAESSTTQHAANAEKSTENTDHSDHPPNTQSTGAPQRIVHSVEEELGALNLVTDTSSTASHKSNRQRNRTSLSRTHSLNGTQKHSTISQSRVPLSAHISSTTEGSKKNSTSETTRVVAKLKKGNASDTIRAKETLASALRASENQTEISSASRAATQGSSIENRTVPLDVINRTLESDASHMLRTPNEHSTSSEEMQQELRQFLKTTANDNILRHARFVLRGGQEGEIRLLLKPEELGTMRVNLHLQNNLINGRIVVDNPTARLLLDHNLPELLRALRENGIDVGTLDVSLNQQHSSSFSTAAFYDQQVSEYSPLSQISSSESEIPVEIDQSTLINLYA